MSFNIPLMREEEFYNFIFLSKTWLDTRQLNASVNKTVSVTFLVILSVKSASIDNLIMVCATQS